jgi:uncharacterized protein with PIN domain
MKAKTIDRLALTREKFGSKLKYGKEFLGSATDNPQSVGEQVIETVQANKQHREGYSTCPSCGQETLIHEDGCMHCRSCGWGACG